MISSNLTSSLTLQRTKGDAPADVFINRIFSNATGKQQLWKWLGNTSANYQLQQLPDPYTAEQLFEQANTLPKWANKKQMHDGANFFARHAQVIMNLLGLLSLPYCYAGADGAMVLYLSEQIRNNTGKRLTDTGKFVWDVMSPSAFEPEGSGFAACLKTRLIHAATRYYTLQGGKWDIAWGVPINQEDMVGTNLSFSLIVIRGLRKLGYTVTSGEQIGFLHLWNVIGHLLGLNGELLSTSGKEANILEEAIRLRQFRSSQQGEVLTNALVNYYSSVLRTDYLNTNDITAIMRYLLGDEIADQLRLKSVLFSTAKINFLKTAVLLNDLKLPASATALYHHEYNKFKKDVAALEH